MDLAYGPYRDQIGFEPGPLNDDYAGHIAAGYVEVIECDGELQGLLVLIPQAGHLLLDNVAVQPACHGRGLGSALLRRAETVARQMGYDRIRLYTHEKMPRNQALYRHRGYVETGRKTERGLNRVYFEKTLTAP